MQYTHAFMKDDFCPFDRAGELAAYSKGIRIRNGYVGSSMELEFWCNFYNYHVRVIYLTHFSIQLV